MEKRMNIGTLSTTFAKATIDTIANILEAEIEELKSFRDPMKAQIGYNNGSNLDKFIKANPNLKKSAIGLLRLEKQYHKEVAYVKAGKFVIPNANYRFMATDNVTWLDQVAKAKDGEITDPSLNVYDCDGRVEEVVCNEIPHNTTIASTRMPNENAGAMVISNVINVNEVPAVMLRKLGKPCTERNIELVKKLFPTNCTMTSAWSKHPIAMNGDFDGDHRLDIEDTTFVSEVIKTQMANKPLYVLDYSDLSEVRTIEEPEENELF